MIPKVLRYRELRSSRQSYGHKALEIEVQLEPGETVEDVLECMKAFVDLNLEPGRIAEAQHIINQSGFEKDSYNMKEAQRMLDENAVIIEKAEQISRRVVKI